MTAKSKRLIAMLLMIVIALAGCSPLVDHFPEEKNIYATFFPIYALSDAIVSGAEHVKLHCMVQPQDGCIRSYQLSDWDLYTLAYSADAILSAGSGLENFSDKLQAIGETILPLSEVMHGLDFYQMSAIQEDEGHFSGFNPHLYMSLDGAEKLLNNIAGSMIVFDENNAAVYEENLSKSVEHLQRLKQKIAKETEVCTDVTAAILNESFFYTATDCSLNIVGFYERESSEMLYGNNLENCLNALSEMNAEIVLIEQQAPIALLDALKDAGFNVVQLNTMSTLSEKDGAEGYFQILEENASKIAAACRNMNR